jgi:hypothetical protein
MGRPPKGNAAAGLATLLTGCMASPKAEDLVFLEDEPEELFEVRAIPFVEPSQSVFRRSTRGNRSQLGEHPV